jgi:hypothetical protein
LLAAREIFFCRGASATPSDRIKNRTTHQHLAKRRWYESADTMPPAAAAAVCGATKRDAKRIARQHRLCIFTLAFGIPWTPSGQGLYSRSSADESGYRLPVARTIARFNYRPAIVGFKAAVLQGLRVGKLRST